jgi:hypothetical protein
VSNNEKQVEKNYEKYFGKGSSLKSLRIGGGVSPPYHCHPPPYISLDIPHHAIHALYGSNKARNKATAIRYHVA